MGQALNTIRPAAELLYFAATICLAIVAIYALKQISLLKADMRARSERAAKEKAIDTSSAYLCAFVPLWNTYFLDLSRQQLHMYDGPIGDFHSASLPKSSVDMATKRYAAISWLAAMNSLEAIAAAFVTGVADEIVGFEIIDRTYCGTVRDMYDILSLSRSERANPYFNSIVRLYQTWSPRLSKYELSVAKDDLEKRILEIPEKHIPSLGPDVGG